MSACGDAVGVDVEGDAVEGLVLPWWVVDSEDDDVGVAVAGGVGDGDTATLVLPGEPSRHVDPVRPLAGDVGVLVEIVPHAIDAAVLHGRVVDRQDDEVGPTVA